MGSRRRRAPARCAGRPSTKSESQAELVARVAAAARGMPRRGRRFPTSLPGDAALEGVEEDLRRRDCFIDAEGLEYLYVGRVVDPSDRQRHVEVLLRQLQSDQVVLVCACDREDGVARSMPVVLKNAISS